MKKTLSIALLIIFLVLALLAFSDFVLPLLQPTNGSLNVTVSGEAANVYLDGQLLGKTPLFADKLRVGDHKVEVVSPDNTFRWQTDTTLSSSSLTTLDLDLGNSQTFSAGENLYFKPGLTELSLLTRPESASIQIDDKDAGSAPLNKPLGTGVHVLLIKRDGYIPRQISINIEQGYKLSAIVYLSANPFEKLSKNDSNSKASLFTISNSFVDLTRSYSDWVAGIKHTQAGFSGTETRFDVLIDPSGKTYITNETEWKNKIATKSLANVGYLAKKPDEKLTAKAASEWAKIKAEFN